MTSQILVLLIAMLLFAAVGALLIYSRLAKMTKEAQALDAQAESISRLLERYEACVGEFQRRAGVLNANATDYVNSLSADASKRLLELNNTLGEQSRIVVRVKSMLTSSDAFTLVQAEQVLMQQAAEPPAQNSSEQQASWAFEARAETLIQIVGKEIYRASEHALQLGLRPRRDRKSTSHSLIEDAKIKGLRDR